MVSTPRYLLGAMSGTSTDGVDVVALQCNQSLTHFDYLGVYSLNFPDSLRHTLLLLQNPNHHYEQDPFHLLLTARRDLSLQYVQAVQMLMKQQSLAAQHCIALGVHGQTIRHNPTQGYTFQIIDAALVAEQTQLRVVSDLRSADVAVGGQGAPLVCAFHLAWLRSLPHLAPTPTTVVLNLGGFSNITLIHHHREIVAGGDCGPANLFLDWCARQYFNCEFDQAGKLAQSGHVHSALLQQLMAHPYFLKAWPASTGREDFRIEWLTGKLQEFPDMNPYDLMRTLLEMSVQAIVRSLKNEHQGTLYYCGGGAKNQFMIHRLSQVLGAHWQLFGFEQLGLPEQAVEAAAFAWLAGCYLGNQAGNCQQVTGAKKSVVLGQATADLLLACG